MSTTSANMTFLLDEVVSAVGWESFYSEPFIHPSLFGMRASGKRRERLAMMSGLTTWDAKQPSQQVNEDSMGEEFKKDFTHTAYGKRVPVERELIDDEEYGLIQEIADEIGITAALTRESHAAALWNDLEAGNTYLAQDALSIANNAHVNADGGNSQDNFGTNALTVTGLENSRIAMRDTTNSRGDQMSVRPRLLVVPNELEIKSWELVRSNLKPYTAENTGNFYNGQLDVIVFDLLTDANAWSLVDPMLMTRNLLWFDRTPLEIFGDGSLFKGTRTLGGYMRYSFGCRDWRFIYHNNPS